jgi:flagellar basal-body rod protein FlgG
MKKMAGRLSENRHSHPICRKSDAKIPAPIHLIGQCFEGFVFGRTFALVGIRTMDPLTMTAAGGMRARMQSLDLLANNLANADTSGYKTDREFYNLYLDSAQNSADAGDATTMPVIERNYTDYSQGAMKVTSSPLDLALEGRGFFAVDSPGGNVSYTRNGAFRLSADGSLVTSDGLTVRSTAKDGAPIRIDASQPFTVTADGVVHQRGNAVGQIAIVDFKDSAGLAKQGNTMFTADRAAQPEPAPAQVHQGTLETSNVGSAESSVRLINVMRQFDNLQKAVRLGDEMNRQALQEVARVPA